MGKHAYLILAHADEKHLQRLVKALDYVDNDIYIHIDKKTDINRFHNIFTLFSKLKFVDNRVDVRWGDVSIINAEYTLWHEVNDKDYTRIHLISGAEYPIKSQEYIHDFFDTHHDEEFIGFEGDEACEGTTARELYKKCRLYHYFLPYIRSKSRIIAKLANSLRHVAMAIQMIAGVRRNLDFKVLYKGSEWVSVTPGFVRTLMNYEDVVMRNFRRTHCCDEVYKQTIAKENNFKVSPLGSLRFVDFKRGTRQSPYTFREGDFKLMRDSDALFARKFSTALSTPLLDEIDKNLL